MPELTVITIFVFACLLLVRAHVALNRALLVGELWKFGMLALASEAFDAYVKKHGPGLFND